MIRIYLRSICILFWFCACSFAQTPRLPKSVPDGPLGDIDSMFLTEYGLRSAALTGTNPPYVEVVGSSLYLHHGGQKVDTRRVLPLIYHALKDVTHVPFIVYLHLGPLVDVSLSDEQIRQLRALEAGIAAAEDALLTGGFNEVQTARQKQILDGSIRFVQAAIDAKQINRSSLERFARTMSPLMLQNADEAGCYQVQSTHTQMMKWKSALSSDEWNRIIAVNKGSHQARYRNAATLYFEWLFHGSSPRWAYPGESARVVYAESLFGDQTAADEMIAVLIDEDASRAFFGNEWRMSEDILSDGAARCIALLPEVDRVWQAK